ncbi:hypothetical protein LSM04_007739 [Trypanosoma melophagium]|uniref:uncharacterized protein n=1 Tax=Trypanosoma melophagium TaxID=715481 RepID=UPI00351AAD3A|nr:hypothetical protein LSM04_007739 [Trypanosoma melophagium]
MANKGASVDVTAPELDPTSRTFDPKTYIRRVYADATHVDFENTLLSEVIHESDVTEEALKELIRDSMKTFIGCKEAMDLMYANDKSLFTGEAIDPIYDAFQSALKEGEALVAPTVELFEELRASKLTKETLAKLMTVWRVPGVIYEYCGVRVPQRQSDLARKKEIRWGGESTGDGNHIKRHRSTHFNEDDYEDEGGGSIRSNSNISIKSKGRRSSSSSSSNNSDKDNSSKKCGRKSDLAHPSGDSDAEDDGLQWVARGALEELPDGGGTSNDYILLPGEELMYWYGTPLARRYSTGSSSSSGSATAAAGAGVSSSSNMRSSGDAKNFEAAVLSLRRAMLYLEENYDLENATVLAEGAGDDDDDNNMNNTNNSDDEHDKSVGRINNAGGQQQKQLGAIALTYRYALALLRAALYLSEQMAGELRHANAADTVLIEDILSSMMDTAIAGVKLRHFCWTARNKLRVDSKHDAAMSGLRKELREGANVGSADAYDEEEDGCGSSSGGVLSPREVGTPLYASLAGTKANSSCTTANTVPYSAQATEQQQEQQESQKQPQQQQQRMEHPVEYYIRITRYQHTRMMERTALRLSREAHEWRQKFMPRLRESNNLGDLGQSSKHDTRFSSSFMLPTGTGGLLGNANDSFLMFNSVTIGLPDIALDASISDRIGVGGFDVDVTGHSGLPNAEAILEAFRTPESDFARFTTFSIGEVEMGGVLECSAAQLSMHSAGLLQQMMDNTDVEIDISANAEAAVTGTLADRLFTSCVDHLELVLVSYWGGIAAAVHAGMFDFDPDANSVLYRMINGPAVLGRRDNAGADAGASVAVSLNSGVDEVPRMMFIPVVRDGAPPLREQSVEAVRKSVKAASDILHALLLTTVNRTVLQSFVQTMAKYREADLSNDGEMEDERVELHAAILVEVILAQWERAMLYVSNAVRRMKVVIGESCTSALVVSEVQAQEMGELLEELEQLRSNLFRCYSHGVGMLAKAYVTLLPSLRRTSSTGRAVDRAVCARVSREFVSSAMAIKLLNLLSVVVDRTAPFLHRFDEVYDGIDLFAAKAERKEELNTQMYQQQKGHSRVLRRKITKEPESDAAGGGAELDATTAFMSQCNSKMVIEHVAEQEEMLLALVANILLVFVDALHHKCQRVSLDAGTASEVREGAMIESLADALCLPTTIVPIVASELIQPCISQVVVRLTPEAKTPQEQQALLNRKEEHFRTEYIATVGEHCELVVDALLGMFLATPQQRISREVHSSGFMAPMMDWQRVSTHTAGAVRPYMADSLLHIARAHERLQQLRQPLLAAAITQRLVAHFALAFVTALTADGNVFEISSDCSTNFLSHGLLLIEAEGRTILSIADALVDGITKNQRAGTVLPELNIAREVLRGSVAALQRQGTAVCVALAARKMHNNRNNNNNNKNTTELQGGEGGDAEGGEQGWITLQQREERCNALVQSAMQRSRYIVQAIIAHVEDSSITAAFKPLGSGVTEDIAERLAKRKEGYRTAQKTRQAAGKNVKVRKPSIADTTIAAATSSSTSPAAAGTGTGDEAGTSGSTRKVLRKKGKKTKSETIEKEGDAAETTEATPSKRTFMTAGAAAASSSMRNVRYASVLQLAAEQGEKSVGAAKAHSMYGDAKESRTAGEQKSGGDAEGKGRLMQYKRAGQEERRNSLEAVGIHGTEPRGRRFKRTLAI